MTFKARLAYTQDFVRVTERGNAGLNWGRGFIRIDGKTVSGEVHYASITGSFVFYPEGKNQDLPYVKRSNDRPKWEGAYKATRVA